MGSITKAPVAPAAPQPVYYYVPAPPPPPPPPPPSTSGGGTDTSGGGTTTPTPTPTPEQVKETRTQSLLRRDRGRLGTILSSFRGILGLSDNTAARKTLLGE